MADKGKAKMAESKAKMSEKGKAFAKKAGSLKTYSNAVGDVANKFAENSDIIYRVLYAIAFFVIICIVIVPTLAFLIIGVICYFLLKDRMKEIKAL